MRRPRLGPALLLVISASGLAQTAASGDPQAALPWAFALNEAVVAGEPDNGLPKRVPGSDRSFTRQEIRNLYRPPDWHPDDHPAMPQIVASGRNPGVFACAYCHLPNGQGRPENASLVGLNADYIRQQLADYRAGLRASSESRHGPAAAMLAIGLAATEEEAAAAAAYFSSLTPRKWIRVVETDTVPQTRIAGWMYTEVAGGRKEAIGNRIIELPEDLERTELRDARSGFVAFVPGGSLARGKQFVETGANGKSIACVNCHGADLRGLGPVPALAGRSPSYLGRQLYDLQSGERRGAWSPLMREAVAQLSAEDIVAITAYLASLDP